MTNGKMMEQVVSQACFIAALDQSGGSTPDTLRIYGIPGRAYGNSTDMFKLMHDMRVRIMTSPAFEILFPRSSGNNGASCPSSRSIKGSRLHATAPA